MVHCFTLFVLTLLCWLARPVQAEPPQMVTQADLNAWWDAAGTLRLSETGYLIGDAPIVFRDGICEVSLASGVLIPVISGRPPLKERIVGVAFVGEGTLAHHFPARADAWRFGNYMVKYANLDPARMKPVLEDDAPFTTSVDRGLMLSVDPRLRQVLFDLSPIRSGVQISEGTDGFDEEYVVTGIRGRPIARAVSINLLEDRQRHYRRSRFDPEVILREDRFLHEVMGVPGEQLRMMTDFRTQDHFRILERRTKSGTNDRWLTCYRDGQDRAQTGFHSLSFVHGENAFREQVQMRLGGESHPYTPQPRMIPLHADNHIEFEPASDGKTAQVRVRSTIQARAEGGAVQSMTLQLPVGLSNQNKWELDAIASTDGVALPFMMLEPRLDFHVSDRVASLEEVETPKWVERRQRRERWQNAQRISRTGLDRGPIRKVERQVLVILPRPLPDGEVFTFELAWNTQWVFDHHGGILPIDLYWSAGKSTGPQPFLPDFFPSSGPSRWNHQTTIGVISDDPDYATVSGETVRSWYDDRDQRWQEVHGQNTIAPRIAVGRWREGVTVKDDPSVVARLFSTDLAWQLQAWVTNMMGFLRTHLVDFTPGEIEVFQDVSTLNDFTALRPMGAGLVRVQGLVDVRYDPIKEEMVADQPELFSEEDRQMRVYPPPFVVYRQVAAQLWRYAFTPRSSRDRWLIDALADASALLYYRDDEKDKIYLSYIGAIRSFFEGMPDEIKLRELQPQYGSAFNARRPLLVRTLSPTTPLMFSDTNPQLRQLYGSYVIAHMLRERLGDAVMMEGMRALILSNDDRFIDTEEARRAFEDRSGQDLSDFFDYWVHGGYLPAIEVTWQHDVRAGRLEGCVHTDIPFGTFELPVRAFGENDETLDGALVDVRNGVGHFSLSVSSNEAQMEIDPAGWVIARERTLKKVKNLDCLDKTQNN